MGNNNHDPCCCEQDQRMCEDCFAQSSHHFPSTNYQTPVLFYSCAMRIDQNNSSYQ